MTEETTAHKDVAQAAGISAEIQRTAGQRRVNILWETTQATAAMAMIGMKFYMVLHKLEDKTVDAALITILSMYFTRTNHTKTGGVGGTDSR